MTKITQYLQEAKGKTLFSIEIIPPMKGQHLGELMSQIEPLIEFKPLLLRLLITERSILKKWFMVFLLEFPFANVREP